MGKSKCCFLKHIQPAFFKDVTIEEGFSDIDGKSWERLITPYSNGDNACWYGDRKHFEDFDIVYRSVFYDDPEIRNPEKLIPFKNLNIGDYFVDEKDGYGIRINDFSEINTYSFSRGVYNHYQYDRIVRKINDIPSYDFIANPKIKTVPFKRIVKGGCFKTEDGNIYLKPLKPLKLNVNAIGIFKECARYFNDDDIVFFL